VSAGQIWFRVQNYMTHTSILCSFLLYLLTYNVAGLSWHSLTETVEQQKCHSALTVYGINGPYNLEIQIEVFELIPRGSLNR
jgi:hypothetical protein